MIYLAWVYLDIPWLARSSTSSPGAACKMFTFVNQGRVVRKPVDSNPGLIFLGYDCFSLLVFCVV